MTRPRVYTRSDVWKAVRASIRNYEKRIDPTLTYIDLSSSWVLSTYSPIELHLASHFDMIQKIEDENTNEWRDFMLFSYRHVTTMWNRMSNSYKYRKCDETCQNVKRSLCTQFSWVVMSRYVPPELCEIVLDYVLNEQEQLKVVDDLYRFVGT